MLLYEIISIENLWFQYRMFQQQGSLSISVNKKKKKKTQLWDFEKFQFANFCDIMYKSFNNILWIPSMEKLWRIRNLGESPWCRKCYCVSVAFPKAIVERIPEISPPFLWKQNFFLEEIGQFGRKGGKNLEKTRRNILTSAV